MTYEEFMRLPNDVEVVVTDYLIYEEGRAAPGAPPFQWRGWAENVETPVYRKGAIVRAIQVRHLVLAVPANARSIELAEGYGS